MKSTIGSIVTSGLMLALSLAPFASAHGAEVTVDSKVGVGIGNAKAEVHGNATSSMSSDDDRGNATSSTESDQDHSRDQERDQDRGNATSTDAKDKGQTNAEMHRSEVATFVKTLLAVADREGGIGAEVREVAKTQQDSASTTVDAMAKVESRSALRTFLFGTDYKSIGQIRSELATTTASIDRLKRLADKSWYTSDKTTIEAQIQALEDSKVQLTAFIDAHENTFSLFGWAVKLFSK